ncbi:ATP-binding protein [Mucilaginibacter jinjuensis]|uniref:histidine kinase n=1 Tax=Mucilaginibacter jinjuensis TaxID=1176721 RepID=A0ABY7TD73_9SPHI|nr:ATP-binding protein [Mucilaginibacter jinjuensis]WCT13117.1 ATP-binding protein [Mucilaginibacter jinjuensis]
MNIAKLIYTALLLMYCSFAYGLTPISSANPSAVNGILDLRGQTFSNQLPLNGQWKFYWHQLLSPQDSVVKNGTIVNFPFKWDGKVLNGKALPAFGYATYRLTVLLPKRTEILRIAMPDTYCAYKLFFNGKQVAENGQVSTSADGFTAYWQYRAVDIAPETDTLKINLQIANFVHSQAGIKKPLTIGTKTLVELDRRRAEAIDLMLTGCLVMGGIFFMGLYLRGNRDKAILLFSLYSIVYAYRIIGSDNYVLHTLLPNINWYITTRLEYTSLFIGICLFGLYTRYLYPKDVNIKLLYTLSGICFAFAAAAICLPPIYFTQLINPFLVVMLFCLVYVPGVYMVAYKRKRPGATYAVLSAFALMIVFAISLFHYWGFIPQLQFISFLCYISFFFLQSLVLSHRVSFVLKKAREQAEQGLKAKSEFLSTMSHEIRTPLNSVIGMSHLLLKNNPRPDQIEQIDVMLFSANNLLAIVNDILDYNKIEAGKIVFEHIEMDIAAIIRNIVSGLQTPAQDKGIDLKLNLDRDLQNKVLGDPTRLFQVISNLAHNAIKFTPKGFVEIGVEVQGQTDKMITLLIRVTDSGIGISPEKIKIIFDRFTQADSSTSRGFGGTGLGLAICKKILQLQHTSLQVSSKPGKGSTFYFIQSFEKSIKTVEQQQHEDNLPKQEDKPFTGVSILLVEDNPINVLVAQKFLERWGARADVAQNGVEALEKLDTAKHQLILMDLHMPIMDGYEATRKMRLNGVTLPIIALTANLLNEIEDQVKLAGITDMIAKPFLPDELFRKVLHYVHKNA